LGQTSELRPVFQLMLGHESGEWEAAAELSASLHRNAEDVAEDYWQAQQWARAVSNGARRGRVGGASVYGCVRSWSVMASCAKDGREGLARLGKDEYHKVVLIEASFPRGPSAPADPRRRLTDPINVKSILRKRQ
jgi:hypothetical protein